ncbi:MAG TPA: AzlC family ABC transporter permease [Burkholderiaceae bacterium]|nr:AzlC family ABC transporter permease [Burkholderiaceae bacterium]
MIQQKRSRSRLGDVRRRAFLSGARDGAVPFIAVGTWGFVTGIAMVKSGLTESMATLMTLMVYAGSAQLTSLPLIEASAPLWLIFAAGTVVNIRFVIFGAALQPYFRALSWPRRLVLGVLSSDIAFVLFMARYSDSRRIGTSQQIWYFLGVAIPGWVVWNACSLVGVYMGGLVPPEWSLEFAAILALMAVIMPLVKSRPMVMCLIAGGLVAWLGQPLPLRLGLAIAVVAGVAAGMVSERMALRARELR